MPQKTDIVIHGVNPEEFRADEYNDDAHDLADQIHGLIQDEYSYLDPTGVSVVVNGVPTDDAADFPDDN